MNCGDLELLSTKHALSILRHYAFGTSSKFTSHIALRCLSNIILLSKTAKQIFIDEGYPELALLLLKVLHPPNNGELGLYLEYLLLIFPRVMTLATNFFQQGYFLSVHPSLQICVSMYPGGRHYQRCRPPI